MIEYREAGRRFVTRSQGRTTWHSFSFGPHYDPGNVSFGPLVALNEEHLPPGTGYAVHPHADLEIVTVVLRGELRHTSDAGSGLVGPGQVQRLSAGSGVRHEEINATGHETVFLQAWLRPDETGLAPSYAAAAVPPGEGWVVVAGSGGVVPVASAGTTLRLARPGPGARLPLPDAPLLHVTVTGGALQLGERVLLPGDSARLRGEGGREVRAEEEAQVWVWASGPQAP